MRLIHKGLIIVLVPLVVALVFIGATFGLLLQCDQQRLEAARERHFQDCLTGVYLSWWDMADGIREFLAKHDPAIKQRIKNDALKVNELRDEAARTKPGYESTPMVAAFNTELQDVIDEIKNLLGTIRSELKSAGLSMGSFMQMQELRKECTPKFYKLGMTEHDLMQGEFRYLRKQQADEQQAYMRAAVYAALTVVASLAVAGLLGMIFVKDIVQRLRVVTDNTLRLAGGSMLLPPLHGRDEIAALDRGFHNMAKALRIAMAKERAIFQSSSDMMCTVDRELQFASINPACSRLLGREPEEMVGVKLLSVVIEEDKSRTESILLQAKKGTPFVTFENRVHAAEGRVLDLLWSVYYSSVDRALYVVAHDITERKAIERLKESFLSMVSHDMRSPLTSIFGTFKLVAAGAFGRLPEAALERVQAVSTNVNRLLNLVNDLLDVEKLESGQLTLARSPVRVDQLINRAVSEVEPLTRDKRIIIKVECPELIFNLDGDRFIQVAVNLLSNAVKFSPEDSTITVSIHSENDVLHVRIADQGRGIPESSRAAIFERFKQVESADGKRRSGTGLGLPICKSIVEQHGGTIGVDSEVGKGSTFWFSLPAEGAASSAMGSASDPISKEYLRARQSKVDIKAVSNGFGPKFANLPLIKKGALLLVIPVLFELVFTATSFGLFSNAFHEEQRQLRDRMIAVHSRDLLISAGVLTFAMNMSPFQAAWEGFMKLSTDLSDSEKQLTLLTAQNAAESEIMARVDSAYHQVDRFVATCRELKEHHQKNDYDVFPHNRDQVWVRYMELMSPALKELIAYSEKSGEQSPAKLEHLRGQQGMLLAAGLLVSMAICGVSALLFSNGIAGRLSVMEDNVSRLEHDTPLNPQLPGNDEVAHLDQVFHSTVRALDEARRKEKAIFQNSLDVMCICDADGKVLRVNPACERQWGYEREQIAGSSLITHIDPADRQRITDAFHTLEKTGEQCDVEAGVTRGDGSRWEGLWSLSWSAEEKNVIAIVHDINERKELERMKQDFLAMVSHDMRTPLASIMTTTEMLTMGVTGELPEKATQQLEMVVKGCDRLLNLINDLLDIEKLEAGEMQLTIQPVAVDDLLKQGADALSSMCVEKSIQLSVDGSAGLAVKADADRVVQVLVNLLSNAIKFSPPGSQIRLTARKAGDAVEFQIIDQGRGIPETQLKTIFERYRQVELEDGKRHVGTGLGLPISKQIVEQHGGTIGVTSQVGQGSTFYFRLAAANDVSVVA
jgi:PAS domain S-box-containing protein